MARTRAVHSVHRTLLRSGDRIARAPRSARRISHHHPALAVVRNSACHPMHRSHTIIQWIRWAAIWWAVDSRWIAWIEWNKGMLSWFTRFKCNKCAIKMLLAHLDNWFLFYSMLGSTAGLLAIIFICYPRSNDYRTTISFTQWLNQILTSK